MTPDSPPLVFKIVRSLQKRGGPRSSADLAREFLGLGILPENLASELIDPVLTGDSRLRKQAGGWIYCPEDHQLQNPLPAPVSLAGSFLALCAPRGVDGWGVYKHGEGEPRLCVCSGGEREAAEYERRSGKKVPRPVISLADCARRLRGYRGAGETIALAEHLGVSHVEGDTLESAARIVAATWESLATELALEQINDPLALESMMDQRLERADFKGKSFSEDDLLSLPEQPGIYIFRAFGDRALYVGQSSQLRARVCSYFTGPPRDDKDRVIRSEALQLETRALDTGLDALIAEARFIRRLDPACNTQKAVRGEAAEDGILLLPTGEQSGRAVLYTLEGGLMRRRSVAGASTKQRRRAISRAIQALETPPPVPAARHEDAVLAASWRRLHPMTPFFRLGFDGDAVALQRQMLAALGARHAVPP